MREKGRWGAAMDDCNIRVCSIILSCHRAILKEFTCFLFIFFRYVEDFTELFYRTLTIINRWLWFDNVDPLCQRARWRARCSCFNFKDNTVSDKSFIEGENSSIHWSSSIIFVCGGFVLNVIPKNSHDILMFIQGLATYCIQWNFTAYICSKSNQN